MKLEFALEGEKYRFDTAKPLDLTLKLKFNDEQPNAFGVGASTARTVTVGDFVGDTRVGGSCNCEEFTFIPHCHGTHTEGVGHILNERVSVADQFSIYIVPATVISVTPQLGRDLSEFYLPKLDDTDLVISRGSLEFALEKFSKLFCTALVIRTLPNDRSKRSRNYSLHPAAFFSCDAMKFIVDFGVSHLLIDLPSADRARDQGKLSNHHIFWNLPQGMRGVHAEMRSAKTITEMIYVPNEICDGRYILSFAAANFSGDAAPSRVVLYEIEEYKD